MAGIGDIVRVMRADELPTWYEMNTGVATHLAAYKEQAKLVKALGKQYRAQKAKRTLLLTALYASRKRRRQMGSVFVKREMTRRKQESVRMQFEALVNAMYPHIDGRNSSSSSASSGSVSDPDIRPPKAPQGPPKSASFHKPIIICSVYSPRQFMIHDVCVSGITE